MVALSFFLSFAQKVGLVTVAVGDLLDVLFELFFFVDLAEVTGFLVDEDTHAPVCAAGNDYVLDRGVPVLVVGKPVILHLLELDCL